MNELLFASLPLHIKTSLLFQVNPVPRSQSLRRGQPNTFTVKPSPMKTENGRRIKMSFKEGQLLNQPRIQVTRPEQVLVVHNKYFCYRETSLSLFCSRHQWTAQQ